MQTLLTVFHLFLAIGLIGLILIQHGRGADAGAAFGSGASATVFGAQGSGSFLSRTTAILAALFFVTSIVMAYYAQQIEAPKGLMEGGAGAIQLEVPVVPQVSVDKASVPEAVQQPVQVQVESVDIPVVPGTESAPASVVGGDVPALPPLGGGGR